MPRVSFFVTIFVLFCCLCCCFTSSASAAEHKRAPYLMQLSAGIMVGEDVKVDYNGFDGEVPLNTGLSGGFAVEFPSQSLTSASLTFNFHAVDPKYARESEIMLEFGLVLKGSMREQRKSTYLRPYIGAGYGLLPEIDFLDVSHWLIVKGGIEIDFFAGSEGKTGGLLDIGLLGSPYGKSEDFSLSAGPRPYFKVGMIFR